MSALVWLASLRLGLEKMAVNKSDQRVRNMFAAIATKYDGMNHLLSLQADRYWRWRTTKLVHPAGTAPILDVCTGTGDLAFAFSRRADGRVPVIAADFCREMLAVGRQKQVRAGLDGGVLTFVEADTQHLPFPDGHFQIVAVAFGLRNVANTRQGLREMVRVCQPGGRVAVLEFSMPARQPFKSLYRAYFRHLLPRIGQWMARNDYRAYQYLPESVGEFPSGDALVGEMEFAGLCGVKSHPLTLGVSTLYVGTKGVECGSTSETCSR